MGLTRSPEEEPEAVLLGTIATGPWAVGTVVGLVIGGHRGRREATEIPSHLGDDKGGKRVNRNIVGPLYIVRRMHARPVESEM